MKQGKDDDRVALVTGAARGIGAATAIALAGRGITAVIAVRRPEAATETAKQVAAAGGRCKIVACDVANLDSVERCIAEVLATWGRLDIVVNNAGQVGPQALLGKADPAEWAATIATNLVGPYYVARTALPELLKRRGVIVNVSTGAAHTPRNGWSAYCSSKAGLYMLSRSLLKEYGEQGLSVYSLQPGLVDTEMQVRIRSVAINEIGQVPRERLAPPTRSAGVIAWLADRLPPDLMERDLSIDDPVLVERSGIAG